MKKIYTFIVLFFSYRIFFAQVIAGGGFHSLVLCSNASVRAWGYNFDGEIGDGTSGNIRTTPVQVSNLTGITALAGGGHHPQKIRVDGFPLPAVFTR